MTTAPRPDPLRPSSSAAGDAWAERVRAERDQVERLREIADLADFYAPMAARFGQDPLRRDDPSLDAVLELASAGQRWLDLGAGGGRYALPLALRVARVQVVEPSASMLEVLRSGMVAHGIDNIDITAARWPVPGGVPLADVALMAHIGYDIEDFAGFLDAAEAAVSERCVVIMRASDGSGPGQLLWQEIHGEPRIPYPTLGELLVLLTARGAVPEVRLAHRPRWGYATFQALVDASRRQLWLRSGSSKDRRLRQLLRSRAVEEESGWELPAPPMQDGVVTWVVRSAA